MFTFPALPACQSVTFESLLSPQIASIFEHVATVSVQCPEAALARFVRSPRYFDETIIETKTMPDAILPPLLVLPVVREQIHDELIDFRKRQHLIGRLLDGHCDQRDVTVRRFGVRVTSSVIKPVLL